METPDEGNQGEAKTREEPTTTGEMERPPRTGSEGRQAKHTKSTSNGEERRNGERNRNEARGHGTRPFRARAQKKKHGEAAAGEAQGAPTRAGLEPPGAFPGGRRKAGLSGCTSRRRCSPAAPAVLTTEGGCTSPTLKGREWGLKLVTAADRHCSYRRSRAKGQGLDSKVSMPRSCH